MLDDPWMADQVGELMELEAKRSAMLLDVKPGSYQVRRLDSSAQHLRGNVVTYLADKMGTVERRRVDLQSDIGQLESRLSNLPKTQRDILTMERKLGVTKSSLCICSSERPPPSSPERASCPEASLIERARYAGKVGPDKRRTILMYTAVGFLIALALAVARMVFFERIESDIRTARGGGGAVIAGIPFYKEMGDDPIACRAGQPQCCDRIVQRIAHQSPIFAGQGRRQRHQLVSSLHPQEGKSFVSANLASILAKAGKKVALVDFDMHKPRVHTYMGIANERGVDT